LIFDKASQALEESALDGTGKVGIGVAIRDMVWNGAFISGAAHIGELRHADARQSNVRQGAYSRCGQKWPHLNFSVD